MLKALAIQARLSWGQHVGLGGLAITLFVVCAVSGFTLMPAAPALALWMAALTSARRDEPSAVAGGRLQCILGMSRALVVRARFAQLAVLATLAGAASALVWAVYGALGRDPMSARFVLAVAAAALLATAVNLTLGYVATPCWQQVGTVATIMLVAAVVAVPIARGADFFDGTTELDAFLYGGPIPAVTVLAAAAVVALTVGSRLAERAYLRLDL